jgi:glutathione synthase/RimK-type ligase-like ATP-grasp enzyme
VRVGFLTAAKFAGLHEDDAPAADALRARGVEVVPAVWTAPLPPRLDVLVMRTPWDWYEHRDRFRAFLGELATLDVPVFNEPGVMAAFADKTYLPRLAARGVRVVPTEVLEPAAFHEAPSRLAGLGWPRAVLKPAFTANAVGAHVFEACDAAAVVARIGATGEPHLLQPFVEGIREGELSFVFVGDAFSHAVRKTPPPGEWRVQHDYGGVEARVEPGPEWVAEAARMLALAAPGQLYARVDCVLLDGALHLMELEVVEPQLFFTLAPDAAVRFADELLARLGA